MLAQADVLPGAGTLKVAPRKRRAKAFGARHVFELGEWEDALQLWAVPRRLVPELARAAQLRARE